MGLIDGADGGESQSIEADVIVASVALGLFRAECQANRDVWIGYGEEKDKDEHLATRKKIANALLADNGESHIKMVLTPAFKGYADGGDSSRRAITAASGPGGQRDIRMSPEAMKFAIDLQANTQAAKELSGIDGFSESIDERGAYYGIVDHPTEVRMISTTRRLIGYNGAEGRRWNRNVASHGMIQAQIDNFRRGGKAWSHGSMAALDTPFERQLSGGNYPAQGAGVVGYCHGMNWAIMHTALLGGGVAYEVAVGTGTTKLASCFGCSTFMYANGAPPSYIHFGRAESWAPIPNNPSDNPEYKDRQVATIDGLIDRWASTVAGYITEGVKLLKVKASDTHKPYATQLGDALGRKPNARAKANLFLDALTVHESDLKRLSRALF